MILKLRHHPGAAGAGANALLEGLDCYIGPRTGLVPAVLHGEQCAVGVFLHIVCPGSLYLLYHPFYPRAHFFPMCMVLFRK